MERAREISLRKVVIDTLLITPSGALSPGMLSASAVAVGAYLGVLGGVLVSLGHMLFELPYVAGLVLWVEKLERILKRLEKPLALITLAFALFFALGLFETAHTVYTENKLDLNNGSLRVGSSPLGAVLAGIVFTGANPYFLAWWVTIGLPLIRGAAAHGRKGFAAMYAAHVWLDYVWLAFLAGLGGLARIAAKPYAVLLAGLGVVLTYFALEVALKAFTGKGITERIMDLLKL